LLCSSSDYGFGWVTVTCHIKFVIIDNENKILSKVGHQILNEDKKKVTSVSLLAISFVVIVTVLGGVIASSVIEYL